MPVFRFCVVLHLSDERLHAKLWVVSGDVQRFSRASVMKYGYGPGAVSMNCGDILFSGHRSCRRSSANKHAHLEMCRVETVTHV
jgi:hypothetical protein